jgi:RimJ/RimL family protein N-acetyltransferase
MTRYELRTATAEDHDFLYSLVVLTMRVYVEKTWGAWDEAAYQERFESSFDPADYQVIVVDGQDAGAVSVTHFPDFDYLSRIYILPAYQNRGIGTAIIRTLIADSHEQQRPLELRVLKTNPRARQLYERLGFEVYMSIEFHHMMRCAPPGPDDVK